MRTKPITYNDSRLAEPTGISDGIARRIGARLLHEVREALPPTIFFFVGFNFIVLTTNLLVAQYLVVVSNFMLATVAALVVGKAVLVANKIALLRRYDRAPLIQPILFKTGVLLGCCVFGAPARAFRALRARGQSAGRLLRLFDDDLLVAPFFRHLPVDPRTLLDLCDSIGIQPFFRPGRNAAAPVHPPAVRSATQSATTPARAVAPEPAHRRALGSRIARSDQRRTPRVDRHSAAPRAIIARKLASKCENCMQKRCCRLAWTEEKKLVTDTNRPAKRWLGALSAAPRSEEISPKNYRPCPECQSRHHCNENERPAPSARHARSAASGRWRRASNISPCCFISLSRPAFATSTARSPSGGHGGGVHVFRIEIPYRLTGYGMSGIGTEEPIDVTHQVVGFLGCS